ncbi:Dabb family protein [Alkalitalea saponilacus]|uniref:Stress responsive A/B Barrel Domain n=1 Tax=Alkalitalea saponilacus TaxID=889453 RepID=A0A1T5AVE5_9BACT|nr:Dabb family protein [Alkalitalea saponilacus]ASB48582.1 stress responsive protein [Alkalitalea saponilacus]SKB38945.1 Stress responsive A/B Barrel Domain [Alkalitalea saponilacus]
MIKHVVLFKFKKELEESARTKKLSELKQALDDLKNHIPELISIETGINANPQESYDLSLISEFKGWDELKAYVVHPEHQKVAVIIRKMLDERACVDYEV